MEEIIKRLAALENITPLLALPSILACEMQRDALGDGDTLDIAEGADSNVRLVHANGRDSSACLLFRTREMRVRGNTSTQVEGVWLGQPVPEEFALVVGLVGFNSEKGTDAIGSIEEEDLYNRCRAVDAAWCLLKKLKSHQHDADKTVADAVSLLKLAKDWERHRLATFNGLNAHTASIKEAEFQKTAEQLVSTVAGLESIALQEEPRGASLALRFTGQAHETYMPGASFHWRPGTLKLDSTPAKLKATKPAKVNLDRFTVKPSRVPAEVLDVLAGLEYDGHAVRITARLAPKLYSKVNDWLNELGGRWHTGKQAHVFPADPKPLVEEVVNSGSCFTAADYEFFATQGPEAQRVIRLARLKPGMQVLEPSAGQGGLALPAAEIVGIENVHCIELMPANVKALQGMGFKVDGPTDFLTQQPVPRYDRVVMNPPFGQRRDLAHIEHAMKWLAPGGRLVAIASTTWQTQDIERAIAFRAMLDRLGATVEEIPAGAFKAAGTDVATTLIAFDIPGDGEPEQHVAEDAAAQTVEDGQLAFF